MDVAIAEVAEAAGDDAGNLRSTSPDASMMNARHVGDGTEMSWASVWPSVRSASEMLSRIFQKASACASFEASTASAIMPPLECRAKQPFELGGDIVPRVGRGRLDQRRARDARPRAARACPGYA